MIRFLLLSICCTVWQGFSASCQPSSAAPFEAPVQTGALQEGALKEASGMAPARLKKNRYWLHNDSGDEARLFLAKKDGTAQGIARFPEKVMDCEDIASGIGDRKGSYVYLGDIGDNLLIRKQLALYIFEEGALLKAVNGKAPVKNYLKVLLQYPDGPHDAETLMIDPLDSLLYIVTKREPRVKVFTARLHDLFTLPAVTLQQRTVIDHRWITAGDVAADGSAVLLRNYDSLFYWKRKPGEALFQTLQRAPLLPVYQKEKQGEAICFSSDNDGFFTTSEGKHAPVYFYKRR